MDKVSRIIISKLFISILKKRNLVEDVAVSVYALVGYSKNQKFPPKLKKVGPSVFKTYVKVKEFQPVPPKELSHKMGIDVGQANENVVYSTRNFSPVNLGPNLSRHLPAPMDIMNRGIGLDLPTRTVAQQDNKGVLISGCMSNQTSADAWMHNKYMGAATYFMIEALKTVDTYSAIVDHMNFNLIEHGYTQRPQFNGNEFYRTQKFLEPLQPRLF